ncbi:MAG: iron-sulfur cluster assembly protein, partial [Salinisphaera sp.]|nr:iron-sulfur cluster assembly protein [Salinisphaera sp.]
MAGLAREPTPERPTDAQVWAWLDTVADPEIPVISVIDLGIIRDLRWQDRQLVVVITPTYSGCPAIQTIQEDIRATLQAHGVADPRLEVRLSPAWSTDWLSERGRGPVGRDGIAPPGG